MSEIIKERCLSFRYAGDDKVEKSKALSELLHNNDIDFVCYIETGSYYSCKFMVRRSRKKWNDIMILINSVKSAKYDYVNANFYITDEVRSVLGNIQEVLIA